MQSMLTELKVTCQSSVNRSGSLRLPQLPCQVLRQTLERQSLPLPPMTKHYGSFFMTQACLQTLLQVAVILIQLHVDCQRLWSEHLLPHQKHQAPRLLRRQRPPLRYLPKHCQSQNHLCLLRKSDDAKELIAAITQIGWVHEGSLENRFPHNAQLEREIRTLEESTRALHLAAGFHAVAAVADLWPISAQFAAQTLTTVPWKAGEKSRFELATGSVFDGPQLQLGQLIHYRLHDPKLRHKFGASTAPTQVGGLSKDSCIVT